jgi:hypothetical protein
MKFFIIIFNILITKSFSYEPIYKYQLKNMYENEKNKFINHTVDNCIHQLYDLVIHNAKQNINTTYFDIFYYYFLDKIKSEIDNNSIINSFLQNSNDQNRYECLIQYKKHQKDNVYNVAFNFYGQPPYNISIELLISKILDRISFIFPDSNISKVNNKFYCFNTYIISWG